VLEGGWRLLDAGSRKWAPEPGQTELAFEPSSVASIVKAASNLSTLRFLQYDGDFPPGTGLDPARLVVRFELENGSSRVLRLGLGDGRGQLLATTEPVAKGPIFLVPEAVFAPLVKAPRRVDLPDNVFAP
jgi:hypothetical protein